MAEYQAEPPTLADKLLVELRDRGNSWEEISDRFKIPADEVYQRYMAYVSKNAVSDSEYRKIQLDRLEKIIDALWDMAIAQKSLDHIETLLKVLEQTNKLLGLNKQKAITEINVIDARQQTLVINYLDAVTDTLKSKVINTVTAAKTRNEIEGKWDEWVAGAAADPLKAIETDRIRV